MTLFSSVALLGGVAVWGLTRGSGYEDWYGIGAPSLLMCLERLVTLQSTGDSRLEQRKKHPIIVLFTRFERCRGINLINEVD